MRTSLSLSIESSNERVSLPLAPGPRSMVDAVLRVMARRKSSTLESALPSRFSVSSLFSFSFGLSLSLSFPFSCGLSAFPGDFSIVLSTTIGFSFSLPFALCASGLCSSVPFSCTRAPSETPLLTSDCFASCSESLSIQSSLSSSAVTLLVVLHFPLYHANEHDCLSRRHLLHFKSKGSSDRSQTGLLRNDAHRKH